VSWPKAKLKDFMSKNPDLHSALKSTLAIDLTRWLQATWARSASQNATRTDHRRRFTAPNDAILARLASRRTGRPIVPGVSGRMRSWLREEAALYCNSQGHS
jgi:hypothetical protein